MPRFLPAALLPVFAAAIIAGSAGCCCPPWRRMQTTLRDAPIENVDLSRLADGEYVGSFGEFLVTVTARVTIRDHRIVSIEILEQKSGPGYQARETVDRMIAAQSPKVDAVSGATGSSRCIMAAVHRALTDPDR